MMMDDKPHGGDDKPEDGAELADDAGVELKSTTQRSAGGGDTRRAIDGGGDTR